METNCVQQVKPLAARSAACFFTRAANSVRGKCSSDLLNRLATCTIGLPSCGQRLARLPARNCSPTSIIGGHSFYFRLQEPVLDKSGFRSNRRKAQMANRPAIQIAILTPEILMVWRALSNHFKKGPFSVGGAGDGIIVFITTTELVIFTTF